MKKTFIMILTFAMLLMVFLPVTYAATDDAVPYKTYTTGPRGRNITTQTAYVPSGYLPFENDLSFPEDIHVTDTTIAVADTGNGRILVSDLSGNTLKVLTDPLMVAPTGVFVTDDGNVYAADPEAEMVFVFDSDGTLKDVFERPTEPIFGINSPFVPTKLAVGRRQNLYIVGEGSTSGIIQLNHTGEFIGFFGTNTTGTSWQRTLSNLLGVSFALNTPTSASNLSIDQQGFVYTVSPTDAKTLKRFNIASVDTLEQGVEAENLIAVDVNDAGDIVTLSSDGVISEYDSTGRLVFSFGGLDSQNTGRIGLFTGPADIAVGPENTLYVLDKAKGNVQVFVTSAFADLVHDGLRGFMDGIYDIEVWEDVLALNQMFAFANSAIGQASYRTGDYDKALEYYALAYDKPGYSDAYWQLRYAFLQQSLGTVFLSLIVFFAGVKGIGLIDRKKGILEPLRTLWKRIKANRLADELLYVPRMLRHPLDTIYDLKHRKRGTWIGASIVYLVVVILSVVTVIGPSFIFRRADIDTFNILRHVMIVFGGIVLFVFSNYLIASINDGEGWLKDVYVGTAYALAPFIVLAVPVVILSYGLTYDEIFIWQVSNTVMVAMTAIYVIVMLKEVHGYSVKELVKNILLTVFTIALLVLILFVFYVLIMQVYDYVTGFAKEVIARVTR
jgi:DNA-binding beta-propeller fold protein YncE